ncbi:transposase [Ochrobactrum sp. GPK 3]|uniref:IS66 family transposase n=1 Tax=Brucella sp. 22210 TaxID=3453892 RepID=UPI0031384C1A
MAHCWAHARCKLKEVFDRDGSEIGAEGLRRIAEFNAVKADMRGIPPGQRLSARQSRTASLAAAFGEWLQAQRARYPLNPALAKSSPISITNGTARNLPDRWSRWD